MTKREKAIKWAAWTVGTSVTKEGRECRAGSIPHDAEACERCSAPWRPETAVVGSNGGLHIQGLNHYTGERFAWGINHYGMLWSYRERYGRFRGTAFGPGARKRLAILLRMARHEAFHERQEERKGR